MPAKIISNNVMMTKKFRDIIDIQRCKMLFCKSDEELVEHFDLNDADDLTKYKSLRPKLAEIILYGEEEIPRTYSISRNNRLYCKGGIQGMKRSFKNFIMKQGTRDYDMKNCHPTLLLYLYQKHKLPCDKLKYYVKNRDVIFHRSTNVDKHKVITLLNMDKPFNSNVSAIDDMIREVVANKETLIAKEEDKIHFKRVPNTKGNELSSKQGNILNYYENLIVCKVMKKFDSVVTVPMYDGFNTYGDECSLDCMNDMSRVYGITWAEKPVESDFEESFVDEDECDNLLQAFKYRNLKLCANDTFLGDYLVSEKLKPIFKGEITYYAAGGIWYILDTDPNSETYKMYKMVKNPNYWINKLLTKGIKKVEDELKAERVRLSDVDGEDDSLDNQDAKIKNHRKLYKQTSSSAFLNGLKTNFMGSLNDDGFVLTLDRNPYKFIFTNGVYDIRDKSFRYGLSMGDKITKTLQYEYDAEVDAEDMKWVRKMLYRICNCNEDHLNFILSILGFALTGTPSKRQEMYFMVGQSASNGKSTILETLTHIMPEYVKMGESCLLESGFDKKHKYADCLRTHRIVWLEEMKTDKNIDVQRLKLISDGKNYTNEIMFGTSETWPMLASLFQISNSTPKFDEADNGGDRRYVHSQFNSRFGKDLNDQIIRLDNEDKLEFVGMDPSKLKDEFMKRRTALTHLLMDYAHKVFVEGFPETPQEFKEEKMDVLVTNDQFKVWFSEATERVDDPDAKLHKQEILQRFKEDEGGVITEKVIVDKLKALKYKYDRLGRKKGWQSMRGCFTGVRFKSKEEKSGEKKSTEPETVDKNLLDSDSEDEYENTIKPSNSVLYTDSDSD
jgi:phage/plasmid-associated DNA primase